MVFHTGAYRSRCADWGIVLQQFVRRDGVPVLFACVCGEQVSADRVADWFCEAALPLCEKGSAERCADKVFRAFGHMCAENKICASPCVVFFAMDEECFYALRGCAEIYQLQIMFDRVKGRVLRGKTDVAGLYAGMAGERACWEAQTGILLGNSALFDWMAESDRRPEECLRASDLRTEEQVQRHLAELCGAAEEQGMRKVAAVFAMPKTDTGRGGKNGGQVLRKGRDALRNGSATLRNG